MSLALAAGLLLLLAPSATAAPVLVLDHGRVRTENDRFVPDTPLPAALARAAIARPVARAADATVRATLDRLLASHQISQGTHDAKIGVWEDALRVRGRLGGTAQAEQTAAINVVGSLAKRGQITASRLNLIFVQLQRNTTWWGTADRIPAAGERVRNISSRVLFQYVPGQGLQFHPLANWGRDQSLLRYGYTAQGLAMANELIPLGSRRGSALAWEYLFYFDGGAPPWTSGLSQGTALIALTAAYRRSHNARYANVAREALRLYDLRAPLGVRVPSRYGAYYAEYSFAPSYRIINGFIQALNGLWDTWHGLGDPHAAQLFGSGEADARRALPYFDLGHWSRYSNRGEISDLNYHVLLRDFLSGLCQRSHIAIYCTKASRFSYYLRHFGGPGKLPPGTRLV